MNIKVIYEIEKQTVHQKDHEILAHLKNLTFDESAGLPQVLELGGQLGFTHSEKKGKMHHPTGETVLQFNYYMLLLFIQTSNHTGDPHSQKSHLLGNSVLVQ